MWHEVFTALIVGLVIVSGTIVGQKLVDDSRAAREDVTIAAEFRHNEQAADLRFVREQSSPTTVVGHLYHQPMDRESSLTLAAASLLSSRGLLPG